MWMRKLRKRKQETERCAGVTQDEWMVDKLKDVVNLVKYHQDDFFTKPTKKWQNSTKSLSATQLLIDCHRGIKLVSTTLLHI